MTSIIGNVLTIVVLSILNLCFFIASLSTYNIRISIELLQ